MTDLNVIQGDFENTYTLIYNDGTKIEIKAGSYFLSDRGCYCFCKENFQDMNKLILQGKFTKTIYEVHRREVFCIFDSRQVAIVDRRPTRTTKKNITAKEKMKVSTPRKRTARAKK